LGRKKEKGGGPAALGGVKGRVLKSIRRGKKINNKRGGKEDEDPYLVKKR